jgi:hypothetical protein
MTVTGQPDRLMLLLSQLLCRKRYNSCVFVVHSNVVAAPAHELAVSALAPRNDWL